MTDMPRTSTEAEPVDPNNAADAHERQRALLQAIERKTESEARRVTGLEASFSGISGAVADLGVAMVAVQTAVGKAIALGAEGAQGVVRIETAVARVEGRQQEQWVLLKHLLEADGRDSKELAEIRAEAQKAVAEANARIRDLAEAHARIRDLVAAAKQEKSPVEQRPPQPSLNGYEDLTNSKLVAETVVLRGKLEVLEKEKAEREAAESKRARQLQEDKRLRLQWWQAIVVPIILAAIAAWAARATAPEKVRTKTIVAPVHLPGSAAHESDP